MYSTGAINPTSLGQEIRANLRIAMPIAVAQLVQSAIQIADQIMVGRLGSVHLAAISLALYVIAVPQLFSIGILSSISALGAQAHGAGEEKRFARIVRGGLVLAILMAFPNMAAVLAAPFFLPWLGLFLGHYLGGDPKGYDPQMLNLMGQYIYSGFLAMPAFLIFTALRNFVTILGKNVSIPVITAISLALGILSNYLLIYGHWGLPRWGIVGAGISLVLLNWFQFIALFFHIRRKKEIAFYRPFQHWNEVDFALLKELFAVGWPASVAILFETCLFISSSFLTALFGQGAAAGYGAALSICTTTFMVPWAIGQAATVCVGRAIGAGMPQRARNAGFSAMLMGVLFMLASGIVMRIFNLELISAFLDTHSEENRNAIQIGLSLIPIAALFQIVDGLQTTAIGSLRGAKDTRIPMIITGIGYWGFGMGSALFLGFVLDMQSQGIFWGLAIGLAATAAMLTLRFWYLPRHAFRYA